MYSPIVYHIQIYQAAMEMHKIQKEKYLGDRNQIELTLEFYQLQKDKFTTCYENHKRQNPFHTCNQKGLWEASKVRNICASNMKRRNHYTPTEENSEGTSTQISVDHNHR